MPYQLTQQRNLIFYNVKDYGADPSATAAVNTTAIQAAINAAAAGLTDDTNTTGAGVFIPNGTYLVGTLILHSFVHLFGAGIQATILQLKNGANADLLQGYNAAALINIGAASNTSSTGGTANWGVFNLTLDGNKANQTSGPSWCIRDYGLGFIVENVRIRNGYSGGWQQDWNGSSQSPGLDSMEAHVTNVKIHDCAGMGMQWGGPHDSQFVNFESFHNDSHGVHLGPNASGMLFTNAHSWGVTVNKGSACWLIEGPGCLFANCIGEGSDVCNVAALNTGMVWEGFTYGPPYPVLGFQLGQVASATLKSAAVASPIVLTTTPTVALGATGGFLQFVVSGAAGFPGTIVLAGGTSIIGATIGETITVSANGTYQSANAYVGVPTITVNTITGYSINVVGLTSPYAGQIQQSGGLATANVANGAMIVAKSNECRNAAINFVNEAASSVRMQIFQTSGTAVLGTPSAFTLLEMIVNGITADGTLGLSGASKFPIKGNNAFRVTDTTQDIFNVNAFGKFIQIPNGTILRTYSDNYTTRGVELSNGTISVQQSATAPVLSTSGTITTSGVGIARVAPAGAVTGIILQAGTVAGQHCVVINEATAANSVTFAAASSNVSGGSSVVIAGGGKQIFVWDSITALWY